MLCRVAVVAAILFAGCDSDHGGTPDSGDARIDGDGSVVVDASRCAAVDIAAGGDHTCASNGTGDLFCWGRGDDGQIGNDIVTNRCAGNTA
ncbi:MAG TPA: RCC1 domain-containing protein, partial [Kofleriaceae bacterium]